jgi:hypothetical protein
MIIKAMMMLNWLKVIGLDLVTLVDDTFGEGLRVRMDNLGMARGNYVIAEITMYTMIEFLKIKS